MNLTIQTTSDPKVAATFIADKILRQLETGKKVLWLVPGGSAILVAIEAAKIISLHPHHNLSVTLTDERYGDVGHKDSNWQQLLEAGLNLPQARLIPVLSGKTNAVTTSNFNTIIESELKNADYRIGLFGIGADGHTAGILPTGSTSKFERITVQPKQIARLDEAIIWAQGEEKWSVIEDLKKELSLEEMPAQILKKVPKLTIFYKND